MKLIFGFLLLLSIGLFVLMQWGGILTGTGNSSQLLNELNPEKLKLLDVPINKSMPASAIPQMQQVVPLPMQLAASAPTSVAAVVAAVSPISASAVVPAIPQLALSASAPVAVAKPVLPNPPVDNPAVKTGARVCMEWGEFSGSDLARAKKTLEGMSLGERLGTRTVEYARGYWVYIPPLSNKAAVNKKIAEIKVLGVDDFFVIRDSQTWNNAISLGVFKTEDAAKKFLAQIKSKGVRSAKLGERKHKLKFTVFTLARIEAELATRFVSLQKEFVNSELKHLPCNN